MRTLWVVLILGGVTQVHGEPVCHRNDTHISAEGRKSEILSRRRRLAFPKGSAFVVTLSILQAIQLKMPSNWNLDLEFDMIWPIPNQESFRKKYYFKRPSMLKRRHRRELYAVFESALDSRNFPGRQCILQTICQAKELLNPPGYSLIEDAIRLILTNFEDENDIDSYDIAYKTDQSCEVAYPCPLSLLKFVLFTLYSNSYS